MFFRQGFLKLGGAFVITALPLAITVLPTAAEAASLSTTDFDALYVFGDSLSDTGNVFTATGGAYPPSPPYFNGRLSNGPLWVEDLGQNLGLTPTPYVATLAGAAATEGINFAFGGSSSGVDNAVFPGIGLPGLLTQVGLFQAGLQTNNQKADPDALYTVWAGANDYLFTDAEDSSTPVNNISLAVSSLAAAGAKNIVVANLPDLGDLPAAKIDGRDASTLTQSTDEHNSGLAAALTALSQQNPDTNVISLDVNSLFDRAIAHPEEFGFQNVTDPCLTQVSTTEYRPCGTPGDYSFWDQFHPTSAAHELVGELAYSAVTPVPEPSDAWGVLALGALGVGGFLKHKQKRVSNVTLRSPVRHD